MRVQCDVCEKNLAAVMCCADEAALCTQCDLRVHAANKLASKHQRVALLPANGDPPVCDICQEKSAFFFCLEDRALLCRDCDVSIHLIGSLSAGHRRFLLTGTRVALEAVPSESPSDGTEGSEEPQAVPATGQASSRLGGSHLPLGTHRQSLSSRALQSHTQLQPQSQGLSMPASATMARGGDGNSSLSSLSDPQSSGARMGGDAQAGGRKGSYSDFLSDTVPSWRVDELLNIPELADGYTLADIGSSKAEAEAAHLGDFDWTADLSLFDEQVYVESLHEVPSLPAIGASANRLQSSSAALKGRGRQSNGGAAVVPDYDDAFVVPDIGLETSPPAPKRRRNFS